MSPPPEIPTIVSETLNALANVRVSQVLLTFVTGLVLYRLIAFVLFRLRLRRALSALPGPQPSGLLAGNLDKYFAPDGIPWQEHLTDQYGTAVKLWGPFGEPQVYLSDPRALENVLLKQADAFEEPDFFLDLHHACFGDGVGAVKGAQHKKQRKRLGPALTVASVKRMAPAFYGIAHELRAVFDQHLSTENANEAEIDVLSWLSRAALEMIAQGGMGYTFNTLQLATAKDGNGVKEHPYPKAAGDLSPQLALLPPLLVQLFHPLVHFGNPSIRRFLSNLVPLRAAREIERIFDVMDDTVQEIYRAKKAAFASQGEKEEGTRPNIIENLMAENKQLSKNEALTENEIIGQMNALIFAAHDTTSGGLTRTLHVLSLRQDLQSRLREEAIAARERAQEQGQENGDIDYEYLMKLPLLDATVKEILRLYPPVASLPRTAKRNVTLPLHHPVQPVNPSSAPITALELPKGTTFYVGIAGYNQDARRWGDDAREFRPERWLESESEDGSTLVAEDYARNPNRRDGEAALPKAVVDAPSPGIYGRLMTFFGGPRSCMGMRFSILEMKIALTVLLAHFKFEPPEDGRQVHWLNHHIMSPHVEGDPDGVHRLPLRVTKVDASGA